MSGERGAGADGRHERGRMSQPAARSPDHASRGSATTGERPSRLRPTAAKEIAATTATLREPPRATCSPNIETPIMTLTTGSATLMIGSAMVGKPAWYALWTRRTEATPPIASAYGCHELAVAARPCS